MLGILITLILILLLVLRLIYVFGMVGDWNNNLKLYQEWHNGFRNSVNDSYSIYIRKFKVNPWKYWIRLDVWTIKQIVKDPFLIHDVIHYSGEQKKINIKS